MRRLRHQSNTTALVARSGGAPNSQIVVLFEVPFHFKRGQMTILDQEGVDLADITEAAEEAVRRGRAIAARDALKSVRFSTGMIIVEDEWRTILEVRLEDIIDGGKEA